MALFFLIVAGFIGATAAINAGPDGNYTGSCALHPLIFARFDDHSIMCIPDHVKAFKFGDRMLITYYGDSAPLSSIKWEFGFWSAQRELLFLARFERNQLQLLSNPSSGAFNSQMLTTHQTIPFAVPKGVVNFRIYVENTKDGLALHTLNGYDMHLPNGAKPFAVFKHVAKHPESDYKYFSVLKPKEIAPKTFTINYDDVVFSPDRRTLEGYTEEIEYTNQRAPFSGK